MDGFSRLILYLKVGTDNFATSALSHFLEGVSNYGIPSRVRLDNGSEFNHVRSFMVRANGDQRSSYINGRSVHNTRIERLWRDVRCKVCDKYINLFNHMESFGILNIDEEVHLAALHYVFGPRLAIDLNDWKNAHNNHSVRTEGYKTPIQMWHSGSIRNVGSNLMAMDNLFHRDINEIQSIIDEFKETWNLIEPADISVVLPRFTLPLTENETNDLQTTINPLTKSDCEGIDIYSKVIHFVHNCISN